MDQYFTLVWPRGTVIYRRYGKKQTLTKVPKNALELWAEGSRTLTLKKAGLVLLKDKTKAELEALLEVRKRFGSKYEVSLLRKAIAEGIEASESDKE